MINLNHNQIFWITNKIRKWIIHPFCATFIIILLAYYLFPSEAVRGYIKYNVNKTNPELSISIDYIKPSFPPSLKLKDLKVYHNNDLFINLDQLKIFPDPFSLFTSDSCFSFEGKAYEGNLVGSANILREKSRNIKLETNLSGIQIRDIPAIKNFFDPVEISGIVSGNIFFYDTEASEEKLYAKFYMSDCKVEIIKSLLNLGNLIFSSIETEMGINKNKLQIKKCIIKGKQLDVQFSGVIDINDSPRQSILNLAGTIKPYNLFITNFIFGFPLDVLPKKDSTNGGNFPFKVYGTIDKPVFAWK